MPGRIGANAVEIQSHLVYVEQYAGDPAVAMDGGALISIKVGLAEFLYR